MPSSATGYARIAQLSSILSLLDMDKIYVISGINTIEACHE
jgi:hypothetical protein